MTKTFEKRMFGDYGPYRVDERGLPLLSDVVWEMLEQQDRSAEQFGRLLGKVTRKNKQPYTKSRIYQMLRNNSFPDDQTRRWVIAKLLQIPPVLMGVSALDELLPPSDLLTPQTAPSKQQPFEIKEYGQTLRSYHLANSTKTAVEILRDLQQRISSLEQETLYGKWEEKQRLQIVRLLCRYLLLFADIVWDQQWYDLAIDCLNKAYQLAKSYTLVDVQAAILFKRGSVFEAQGGSYKDVGDVATARQCYCWARDDFLAAQQFEKHLYAGLRGHIQLYLGVVSSSLAAHPSQLHQAILEIGKAEGCVGKSTTKEDVYFVKFDEERYHLSVSAAYMHSMGDIAHYPKDARRKLWDAFALRIGPRQKVREAYETILLSKSYLLEKEYEEATKIAKEALVQVQAVGSKENQARVAALGNSLLRSDYGKKNEDVEELVVAVTTAQHPGLLS